MLLPLVLALAHPVENRKTSVLGFGNRKRLEEVGRGKGADELFYWFAAKRTVLKRRRA
jgi:hypothetical protein